MDVRKGGREVGCGEGRRCRTGLEGCEETKGKVENAGS